MFYNAAFICSLLLSTFQEIGEEERMSVELILDLVVSFELEYGRIAMSRDVYGKARMFRSQLIKLAEKFQPATTVQKSDFGYIEAHALLLSIVRPLASHLSPQELREIQKSINDAHKLLDLPLSKLQAAVDVWCTKNFELSLQTTPLPRATINYAKQTRSLPRMKTRPAKRHGWNVIHEPGEAHTPALDGKTDFNPLDWSPRVESYQPWWVERSVGGQGLGLYSVSTENFRGPQLVGFSKSSEGPITPSYEYWTGHAAGKRSFGASSIDWSDVSERGAKEVSKTVGQRLKKGLKAIFSS